MQEKKNISMSSLVSVYYNQITLITGTLLYEEKTDPIKIFIKIIIKYLAKKTDS